MTAAEVLPWLMAALAAAGWLYTTFRNKGLDAKTDAAVAASVTVALTELRAEMQHTREEITKLRQIAMEVIRHAERLERAEEDLESLAAQIRSRVDGDRLQLELVRHEDRVRQIAAEAVERRLAELTDRIAERVIEKIGQAK